MSDTIGILIISVIIFVILFLVFREVMCWYWKINEIVALLSRIEAKLTASTNHEPSIRHIEKVGDGESDPMKKYGITFENNQYIFKGYKYDKLENAINYAKMYDKPQTK